jgi:hypothetical protein
VIIGVLEGVRPGNDRLEKMKKRTSDDVWALWGEKRSPDLRTEELPSFFARGPL